MEDPARDVVAPDQVSQLAVFIRERLRELGGKNETMADELDFETVADSIFNDFLERGPSEVSITAGVVASTGLPFVHARGLSDAQLEPNEARALAATLLECAEVADQEALLFRWLQSGANQSEEQAARIIYGLRAERAAAEAAATT